MASLQTLPTMITVYDKHYGGKSQTLFLDIWHVDWWVWGWLSWLSVSSSATATSYQCMDTLHPATDMSAVGALCFLQLTA